MSVETSADLLNQLRDEVGFDVSGGDATLLGWLNGKHRLMVARSKCYVKRLVFPGGTASGQPDYAVPSEVIEVRQVEVGGVLYDRAKRRAVLRVRNASAVFVQIDGEGVVAEGANPLGGNMLTIYPTPSSGGVEIASFGPVRAPELTVAGVGGAAATNSPVVPSEYFVPLVHGAASTGLKRTESRAGEAAAYDREFDEETEALRRATKRLWNTGPTQIEVAWPV